MRLYTEEQIGMTAERAEPQTYTIDDMIRVPIMLRDEQGVGHVRAIFRRMHRPGNLGPRGLDPDNTLELRGNGGGSSPERAAWKSPSTPGTTRA